MATKKQINEVKNKIELACLTKKLSLIENVNANIYGTPVNFDAIYRYNGNPLLPIWGVDKYTDRTLTIRTVQDLDRTRNVARYLAETNPHAKGIVKGMLNYVIGKGSKPCVVGADEEDPPEALTKKVKKLLKNTLKDMCWKSFEDEVLARYITDGEVFIRIFPSYDSETYFRFVEPQQVRPPMNESHEGPWSFGVLTRDNDVCTPVAYNLHNWETGKDEIVQAHFIFHIRANVNANVKRGVTSFYDCGEELRGAERSRWVKREGQKVRDSLAYIRQHSTATKEIIEHLREESFTDIIQAPTNPSSGASPRDVYVQQVEPGRIDDIPAGMEYKDPPMGAKNEATENVIRMALEAAAASFQCPSWLVTGSADASSYASSLVAESPFVKVCESLQGKIGGFIDKILTAIIEVAVDKGILPADTFEQIDILVEYPSVAVRNQKDETDRNKTLNGAGILSKETWATREDLDYEKEQSNIATEPKPEPVEGDPANPDDPQTMGGNRQADQGE